MSKYAGICVNARQGSLTAIVSLLWLLRTVIVLMVLLITHVDYEFKCWWKQISRGLRYSGRFK
jgi:hypothetical protein